MRIVINIEKRHVFFLLTLVLFLAGVIVLTAYTGYTPGVGHMLVDVGCQDNWETSCDNDMNGYIDYAQALYKKQLDASAYIDDTGWIVTKNIAGLSVPKLFVGNDGISSYGSIATNGNISVGGVELLLIAAPNTGEAWFKIQGAKGVITNAIFVDQICLNGVCKTSW